MKTVKGHERRPRPRGGLYDHEIEPRRSVVNDWDKALLERWTDRKARRAAERETS